uniref:Uncharacterized protein n=1 Tax=Sphaerodactylus townsendi TaxID=933632 RepID=A0ACB8FX34_9SAUR
MSRASCLLEPFTANEITTKAGVKDECASCAQPACPAEHLATRSLPLHQSGFCCKCCGTKLSLLNCAILHRGFYCQLHYKLLAKGGGHEENSSVRQKCLQPQTAMLPSPGLELKSRNNQTGNILMREKMQPWACNFHPEGDRRSPKPTRPFALQNKVRIGWPPSEEVDTPEETLRKLSKFGVSKKPPRDRTLFQPSPPAGFTHKAPGYKTVTGTSHTEEKERLLPGVTFPTRRHCVSCRLKPKNDTQDLEVREKKLSSTDRKILGVPARKSQPSLPEKPGDLQPAAMFKWKGSIPTASPLTLIPAEPLAVGSSPFHPKSLQKAKAIPSAKTAVLSPHGANLPKASLKGYSLSGCFCSKDTSGEGNKNEARQKTELRLKAGIKLPMLTKLDNRQNRKAPEASKTNTLLRPALEEPKQFRPVSPELKREMEDHELSQTKPEASVSSTEHKDENSNKTKGRIDRMSASYPDPLETRGGYNQVGWNRAPGSTAKTIDSVCLQRHEKQS